MPYIGLAVIGVLSLLFLPFLAWLGEEMDDGFHRDRQGNVFKDAWGNPSKKQPKALMFPLPTSYWTSYYKEHKASPIIRNHNARNY